MLHVTTKYQCQVLIICLGAKRLKKVRGFLAATQTPLQFLKASDLASALFGSIVMLVVEIDRVCNRRFNDRLSGADTGSFKEYF